MSAEQPHPELVILQVKLQAIHDAIANFHPPARRIPILDSSLNIQIEKAGSVSGVPVEQPQPGPKHRAKATDKREGKERAHAGLRDEWSIQGQISGLKKLKDTIRIDLDVLDKFLQSPTSSTLPPLSTNAPYLIAVWNEVLAAQQSGGVKAVFKSFLLDGDERKIEDEDQEHDSDAEAGPPKGVKSNGKVKGNKELDRKKTKVDVVADGGTSWVRVNTIKNARILSELREIDSYFTDSESEDEEGVYGNRPSLAQKTFDNSILRMGRTLIQTAKNNTVRVGKVDQRVVPRITLRMTRMNPDEPGVDARLAQTVETLREMGITVEIGERNSDPLEDPNPLAVATGAPSFTPAISLKPTLRINADLSVLIALISDLTHAPLPPSVAEAKVRYVPPPTERDWKKKSDEDQPEEEEEDDDDLDPILKEKRQQQREDELLQHSRALTNQLLQEMGKSMVNEIKDRLLSCSSSLESVEFWTTVEARDRCLRIVDKIAGEHEKNRVRALFDGDVEAYWAKSRYAPDARIPIMPLHYYDETENIVQVEGDADRAPFFHALERTCVDILGEDGSGGSDPHPIYDKDKEPQLSGRAQPVKFNPRLTGHTVRTLLWGAKRGWTTLTANRTSVKAVVREVGRSSLGGLGGSLDGDGGVDERAAIWIVDPRSLAEGMRNDLFEETS